MSYNIPGLPKNILSLSYNILSLPKNILSLSYNILGLPKNILGLSHDIRPSLLPIPRYRRYGTHLGVRG